MKPPGHDKQDENQAHALALLMMVQPHSERIAREADSKEGAAP